MKNKISLLLSLMIGAVVIVHHAPAKAEPWKIEVVTYSIAAHPIPHSVLILRDSSSDRTICADLVVNKRLETQAEIKEFLLSDTPAPGKIRTSWNHQKPLKCQNPKATTSTTTPIEGSMYDSQIEILMGAISAEMSTQVQFLGRSIAPATAGNSGISYNCISWIQHVLADYIQPPLSLPEIPGLSGASVEALIQNWTPAG